MFRQSMSPSIHANRFCMVTTRDQTLPRGHGAAPGNSELSALPTLNSRQAAIFTAIRTGRSVGGRCPVFQRITSSIASLVSGSQSSKVRPSIGRPSTSTIAARNVPRCASAFTTSCRRAVPTDLVLDQESRFYIYLDVLGRDCTRPRRRILYCRRDLVNGGDARIKQTTRRLSWTSYAGLAEVRNRLAFFRV